MALGGTCTSTTTVADVTKLLLLNKCLITHAILCTVWQCPHLTATLKLNHTLTALCGFRGCKNRPTPFPGRMSYNATKPGLALSVVYLGMLYSVLLFIRAPFMYGIVSFCLYVFCLKLFWLSCHYLPSDWLERLF